MFIFNEKAKMFCDKEILKNKSFSKKNPENLMNSEAASHEMSHTQRKFVIIAGKAIILPISTKNFYLPR